MSTKKDKTAETKVEENVTPETTTTTTNEDTKVKKTTKKIKTEETKVYKFKAVNKFLSCNGLGVQFINGEASITNLEVAKALVKFEGVEMIEND